jgi:2-oxoglutarate ferredoxin oxidoreductase subunit beta
METLIDKVIPKELQEIPQYKAKDFKSDIDVRWCPGCGNYSILTQIQKAVAGMQIPKEKFAFISGIGCSSRFPYYMDVYGFHGIHGRALAIASGVKIARPDLSVWVITGDGDGMSIGGNHFIHACRRNVNMNVVLFNNEIYSLTKGQFSPTSRLGQKTKSSPLGVLDDPFNPTSLALGSGASFVARGYDKDTKLMKQMLERAEKHHGMAFVELYTDCVIFNEGAFEPLTRRETKFDTTIQLEHGKPLTFGVKESKGLKLDGYKPVVVDLTDGSHSVNDLIVHDETDSTLGFILSDMSFNEELPRPIGIIHAKERDSYDKKVDAQIAYYRGDGPEPDIMELLKGDNSWEVE